MEELRTLERNNRHRSERLRQVKEKNFPHKEAQLKNAVNEYKGLAAERLSQLVLVRQTFIDQLYRNVFPIEVLPLSYADAGEEGEPP